MTKPRVVLYEETCDECKKRFTRPSGRAKHLCQSCRVKRALKNAEAQHLKAGPLYEDSVRRQIEYWASEARRLGLEP